MSLFGSKNKTEPVPTGVKLLGDRDKKELTIDELTAEILKQDINTIREFYVRLVEKLNENLNTVAGISTSQEHIDGIICALGKTNDQLVLKLDAILGLFDRNQKSIYQALLTVINSQNKLLAHFGLQDSGSNVREVINSGTGEIFPQNNFLDGTTTALATGIDGGERSLTDNDPPNMSESQTERRLEEDRSAENDDEQTLLTGTIDPSEYARQLLKEIIAKVTSIGGEELSIEPRDAENLPGIQAGRIWLVAIPPKTDGKYDNTVLQDDAYRKIRNCMKKNENEKVFVVYRGEINSKALRGAHNSAKDAKLDLVNFSDLTSLLADSNFTDEVPAV